MIKLIKRIWFAFQFRRAVRRAKAFNNLTGLRYYVICLNGKLKVIPKRTIRDMVSRHRFRKGVTVQDIERRALFIT